MAFLRLQYGEQSTVIDADICPRVGESLVFNAETISGHWLPEIEEFHSVLSADVWVVRSVTHFLRKTVTEKDAQMITVTLRKA